MKKSHVKILQRQDQKVVQILFRSIIGCVIVLAQCVFPNLKVPKREIFDRSNFPDFDAMKSSWVCDLVVKILTCYFNF